jgi:hypothetical protein
MYKSRETITLMGIIRFHNLTKYWAYVTINAKVRYLKPQSEGKTMFFIFKRRFTDVRRLCKIIFPLKMWFYPYREIILNTVPI